MPRLLAAFCPALLLACQEAPPKPPQEATAPPATAALPQGASAPPASAREVPGPGPGACVDAECAYDASARACRKGAARGQEAGPQCACAFGGSGCVIRGWQGQVPCRQEADCSCTGDYKPAPGQLFLRQKDATPTTGSRPGDCITRCRKGLCVASQGPE